MSDSASSSTREYSDDSQQCIIEAMESIIEDLQDEVKTFKATIDKLNTQIITFQSIQHSDLINNILKYI